MAETCSARSSKALRTMALVFVLLLAMPMLSPPSTIPAGHADERADGTGPTGDFLLGYGSARGTGVRVGPSRSGFNFTTDFAISLADFQNTVARGDSRGVSLGTILETAAEAFDEDGEYVPSNLRIDSRDEDAAEGVSRNEFGTPPESPFAGAVGSQYVRATDEPFSEVETLMGVLGLDGAVELEGGTSRATAGIVDEGQREARGEATFERLVLGGGAIVLEGLEWTALHRSGVEEAAEATFTLGGLEIAGSGVIPEDLSEQGADGLAQAFDAANEALAAVGLSIEAPEKVVNEDTGQVAMTPLKVALGPSEGSRRVAGPFNDALQPVREPLADALLGLSDSFGAVLLLFDVGLGAFAGGGELLLEIGGARAVTGAQEYDDPFGAGMGFGEGFGEVPEQAEPEAGASLGQPSQEAADDGSSSAAPGGGTDEAPVPETAAQTDEDAAAEQPVTSEPPQTAESGQDELAATAGAPGRRGGQALAAALIALLVAVGLGGADFLRLRQSQRTIPA